MPRFPILVLLGLGLGLLGSCGGSGSEAGGAPVEASYEANKYARLDCTERHRWEVKGCTVDTSRELDNPGSDNPRWHFELTCERRSKRDGGDWSPCPAKKTLEQRMGKWVVVED